RRTAVVHAVAALGKVAVARRRTADARALRIRRARGARPGAVLRRVAAARRGTALERRGLEDIVRAGGARSGARLRDVADARRAAAGRAPVPRRMLTGSVRPIALIERADVAVVGTGGAGRFLCIRGARRTGAGAALGEIALTRSGAADGPGVGD